MHVLFLTALALLAIGMLPRWSYSRDWGYFPSGTLGLGLVIILFVTLL